PIRPAAYLSAARFPDGTRDVLVRTTGDPLAIVAAMRASVASLAAGVPLSLVEPLSRAIDIAIAPERTTTVVLSAFAAIAILLGGVGVFGVIAGDVGQRRKEIGLRMALGARAEAVIWAIARRTLSHALVGLAAGGALTLWISRAMQSLLFGVAPLDPRS